MSGKVWLLLLALSVLWGGSFFFIAVALDGFPPLTLVLGRVVLAALLLMAFLKATGVALPRGRTAWIAIVGMAVLNNVIPFTLLAAGQTALPSGLAAILNATTPLFTVLVMHALTEEKITGPKAAGLAFGFLGVVTLMGPAAAGVVATPLWAILVCLGATLSYAFSGWWGRRFKALGVEPKVAAWGQVTASSLIMLPIALAVDQPWTLPMPSATSIAALVGLAALSTALAYVLFFRILAEAGPTNLLLVTFLIPVTAILLGGLVLGERLAINHFIGMALIGAGLAAIDGRLWRRFRGR